MALNRLLERRTTYGEVESRAKGSKFYVEGYAAVFNKRSSNLGGFIEVVRNTAFNKTIKEADVRALWNHDPQYVLGRAGSGTLSLSIDTNGLYYRAEMPDTQYARDLANLLERRDVHESSFTFFKVNDAWDFTEQEDRDIPAMYPRRSLVEVGLIDVAPVTFPAYNDATSGVARRAALDGLAKRCGINGCEIESKLDTDESVKEAIQRLLEPDESTVESRDKQSGSNATQQNSKLTQEMAKKLLEEQDDFSKYLS